ncbi:MAG TPA: ATP-binding protein, partial [Candidatus Aenigmarchaeota archaeon]|nr:ATP-binding protein [Candidatus Aenigmarchaeota archaeon]
LAILAMTGAGKSYACRTILESLAEKGYPMLILDKHGDYVGLKKLFGKRVKIFVPKVEFLEEAEEDLVFIVNGLSENPLTETMIDPFMGIFKLLKDPKRMAKIKEKFERYLRKTVYLTPNLWGIVIFIDALFEIKQLEEKDEALEDLREVIPNSILTAHTGTLRGIRWRCLRATNRLIKMSEINKKIAENLKLEHEETPTDPKKIIDLGQISIIFLSGYEDTISSTCVGHLLRKLFDARINEEIEKFLIVIEEAHTFAPSPSEVIESAPSLGVIKTIITEGRKFGVGVILISQRPSRLNSTILSQCNSFIILRIVNPADQKFVRDVVETIGEEEAKILPDLSTGEALLSGQFVNFPVMVKIKKPKSKEMRLEKDFIEEIYEKWKESSK